MSKTKEKKAPLAVRLIMNRKVSFVMDVVIVGFFVLNIATSIFADKNETLRLLAVMGWVSTLLWFFMHKAEERWVSLYRGMANDTMKMLDGVLGAVEKAAKNTTSKK